MEDQLSANIRFHDDADGKMLVDPEQAPIVKRIFREFLEGMTTTEIANRLKADNIPGVTGEALWNSTNIENMLKNEKYKGDVLMQKSCTVSFLTKQRVMNDGKYDQYYMENHHEAIVTREEWDAVQIELARREKFREDHHNGVCSCKTGDPFFAKVFCGRCGERIIRTKYRGIREPVYKCCNSKRTRTCDLGIIRESTLHEFVVDVWNDIVVHQDRYQDH